MLLLAVPYCGRALPLNLGSHMPRFWKPDGKEVVLSLAPGKTAIRPRVWSKGKVCVNLIGVWKKAWLNRCG